MGRSPLLFAFCVALTFAGGISAPVHDAQAGATLLGWDVGSGPASGPLTGTTLATGTATATTAAAHAEPEPGPDANSDSVGATPGTFRVDEGGSSTYNVPIYVPPGTAGITPQLSFAYQHRGGNGPLGPGFGIGGLSAITRCRKSSENGDGPGPFPGINFDADGGNDAYCLDGTRLWRMQTGAGSCPVASGATAFAYAVETDPSLRVCGYEKSGIVGTAFWLAQPKDGSYRRYGVAGNSALPRNDGNGTADASKILSWNLDRIADASGNVVEFRYNLEATRGELNIAEVSYTGRIALNTLMNASPSYVRAPYNTVQFTYVPMPAGGQRVDYLSGMKLSLTQQLSSVTVSGTTNHGANPDALQVVRTYSLEYSTPTASGVPALVALRECAGGVCYPRTRFTWNSGQGLPQGFPNPPVSTSYNIGLKHAIDFKVADINSDGRQDLIWLKDGNCDSSGSGALRFQLMTSLSTGTGYAAPLATGIFLSRPSEPPLSNVPGCGGDLRPQHFETLWHLYDFSGDGRDDILASNGSAWYVFPAVRSGASWTYNGQVVTPTGMTATPTDDGKLIDLDADGLPDFLRGSGTGYVNARYLRRAQSATVAYAFTTTDTPVDLETPESPSDDYTAVGHTFSTTINGIPPSADIDGDGAADLMAKVTFERFGSEPVCDLRGSRPARGQTSYVSSLNPEETQASDCKRFWYTFRNAGIQASGRLLFTVDTKLGLVGTSELSGAGGDFQLADINADGQADVLYQRNAGSTKNFYVRLNGGKPEGSTGTDRLLPELAIGLSLPAALASRVQLLDLNGDHKLDVFYAPDLGTGAGAQRYPLRARRFDVNSFGVEVEVGNTVSNSQSPTAPSFLIDATGDGVSDLVRFDGNAITIAGGGSTLGGNDLITYIVNGLGAVHTIDYAPLPYTTVYAREFDGPSKVWGRGAPVFDVFSSLWVVRTAWQTAPTAASGTAVSGVRYRYSGARMQAGGRGFLGFKTIQTEDIQNLLVTTTEYRQDFPYTGRPVHTVVEKIDAPIPDPCVSNPQASGCFREPPDNCGPNGCPIAPITPSVIGVGGRLISDSTTNWATTPAFNSAAWQSVYVFTQNADEQKFDLNVAERLSHQIGSTFAFDSYGNLLSSTVTTSRADDKGELRTDESKITTNVYGCTIAPPTVAGCVGGSLDNERRRLGRLSIATVDSIRTGAGSVKRRASFEYDATRLLLVAEIQGPYDDLEPDAEQRKRLGLRTDYMLDADGNKTAQYQCSTSHYANRASCTSLSAFQQRQWEADPTRVHRYARWTYEPKGRFVLYSLAPFFKAGAGSQTDETFAELTGVAVVPGRALMLPSSPADQIVMSRNAFGDPFNKIAATGMGSTFSYGALGRARFESSSTGSFGLSTYTWCADANAADIPTNAPRANCPSGAVFRTMVSSVASTGINTGSSVAPTRFAYFDRLGREMLVTTRVYQKDSASPNRWSSVATSYDDTGRTKTATVAYFSIDPTTQQSASNRAGKPLGTTPARAESHYDAIGRAVLLDHPEQAANGASSTVMSYDKLKADAINPRNYESKQSKNSRDEVLTAEDADGLVVNYDRDAVGNLTAVRRKPNNGDSNNTEITTGLSYDRLGRKRSITDPDKGIWTYEYNALGELVAQTDAKGQTQALFRDALGRVYKRTETRLTAGGLISEPTSTWEFDTATRAGDSTTIKGMLKTETNGLGGFTRETRYDDQGRVEVAVTTLDATAYTERQTYDEFGRPFQHFAPNTNANASAGEYIDYSVDGYPIATTDTGSGLRYSEVLALTARGQVRQERFHNNANFATTRDYEDNTGRLLAVDTRNGSGASAVQRWEYTYDKHTDLTSRWNKTAGFDLKEDFTYDSLDRLKTVTLTRFNGAAVNQSHTLGYDQLGNLKSRVAGSTTTNWTYGVAGTSGCTRNAGPHAVSAFGANRYCYDANGNQTDARYPGNATRSITYTGYDLPDTITTTGNPSTSTVSFKYAPDRGMWKRTDGAVAGGDRIFCSGFQSTACAGEPGGGSSAASTTYFVGNVEIRVEGTTTTTKRYVGSILVITTSTANQVPQYAYLFRDALGSLDAITNEAGVVQQRLSFDAWGRRRTADPAGSSSLWNPLAPAQAASFNTSTTRQGYTGHQQLDGVGLVHMKGRLYDPELGRFIQADSFTEANATQGLNRYSYVLNNPLSLTDPSGHLSTRQWIGLIIACVASYVSGQYWIAADYWASLAVAVAGGFLSTYVATGSWRAGLWGAFSAGVFWGIGAAFSQGWAYDTGLTCSAEMTMGAQWAKVAAHGAAGGVLSELQGGNFGSGFLAAGATQAVSPAIDSMPAAGQFVASAVVGGTVSEATGGSFANGAVTSAFAFLFNKGAHRTVHRSQIRVTYKVSSLNDPAGYSDDDAAALAQYKAYESDYAKTVGTLSEVTGLVVKRGSAYFFTDVAIVPSKFTAIVSLDGFSANDVAGYTHTHPDSTGFNGVDYQTPAMTGKPNYVRNTSGNAYRWDATGAAKYKQHVENLTQSGSQQALPESISSPQQWGIHSICPGGGACLSSY